jgi:hypothetical protein
LQQDIQDLTRQPVLWMPPSVPESVISRLQPITERPAITTAGATLPTAQKEHLGRAREWQAGSASDDAGYSANRQRYRIPRAESRIG